MSKEQFFDGLDSRPAGVSPLSWVARLGDDKPEQASVWLLEWLRRPSSGAGG